MKKLTGLERNWILYDVGNSAFVMLTSTVIPIYFKNLAEGAGVSAGNSTAYFSYASSLVTVLVMILGPLLGTVADGKGRKKEIFTGCMLVGALGCAALAVPAGWLAFLGIYVLAKTGYQGSLIFYDSMLGDVTEEDRMDQVSAHGYAWGYIGSCIPFVASILLILNADTLGLGSVRATMLAFLLNAVWWSCMTLPLLKTYRQRSGEGSNNKDGSFVSLARTVRGIRQNPKVLWFLLAFFFYIDGVYTIIDLATSYGKDMGISDTSLMLALLLTQVVAFPCSILFGKLTKKIESGKLIAVSILGYLCIVIFALQLDKTWEFWFLAVCVAVFQGGIQALSRSYFTRIIPQERAAEYFGFYDIFGKGAAFMGTLMVGVASQVSGSSRTGVGLLAILFLIGFFLFRKADRIGSAQTP
ncbi:MFS transporter [Lachnoclostridium sp. An196]|uniref:MFS transporter n=1 Tax=Lachnoclostridium sp. An196 TaxID=1965583 RepID=UPI000B37B59D|nr:MFS transporter [Lachnoclostridium sp. An196]OUP19367.1 MFS transporter [Lachnoclostridium sp. An196]